MSTLFKHYFFRLLKSKSFWISFIIASASGLLIGLVLLSMAITYSMQSETYRAYSVELVLRLATNTNDVLASMTIPPVATVAFLGALGLYEGDVKSGGLRSYIVSGYNRKLVYITYFLAGIIVTQIIALSFGALLSIPALLGKTYPFTKDGVGNFLVSVALQQCVNLLIYAFCFFFATLTGRIGASIGIMAGTMVLVLIVSYIVVAMVTNKISKTLDSGGVVDAKSLIPYGLFSLFLPFNHSAYITKGSFDHLLIGRSYEVRTFIDPTSPNIKAFSGWSPFIITSIALENVLLAVGLFFLGLKLFERKDLK